jgi:hypothetical protein
LLMSQLMKRGIIKSVVCLPITGQGQKRDF